MTEGADVPERNVNTLILQDGPKVLIKVEHCPTYEVPDTLGYYLVCPDCQTQHVCVFNYHGIHDEGLVFVMVRGQFQQHGHYH
jgi:hypothetical protein